MNYSHQFLQIVSLIVMMVLLQPFLVIPSLPSAAENSLITTQTVDYNFTSVTVSNSTLNSILANPPVYIDKNLFLATVPSYATVGLNNTLKVLVYNNSDQPIPVFFRVEGPINVMTVHPIYVEALIPPYGQVTGNFTMVAFSSSSKGMINVTAVLYIWFYSQMNQPKQVDQVSDTVFGVHPYPYSPLLIASLAMLIIVPISITTAYYLRLHKRRKSVQPVTGASQ